MEATHPGPFKMICQHADETLYIIIPPYITHRNGQFGDGLLYILLTLSYWIYYDIFIFGPPTLGTLNFGRMEVVR